MEKLTDEQVQKLIKGRKKAMVSLACEGMYLTDEDIALFEFMEREKMTPEQRVALLKEDFRKRYLSD